MLVLRSLKFTMIAVFAFLAVVMASGLLTLMEIGGDFFKPSEKRS